MTDSLADRLKKLAEQHTTNEQAELSAKEHQEKLNIFISDKSQPEYRRLLTLIQKRVEDINPAIGDLPKFQFTPGSQVVEQGNSAAYIMFDKPIINRPDNALLISFAPHQNAMYLFGPAPQPERYRLQAAASDGMDNIVWVGDLGELKSEQLADFILEHLTQYYLEHKPK